MDRPLTTREAQFVRENPQLDWPAETMAEAWCVRRDQMLPYDSGTDPTLPDPELTRAESKLFVLTLIAAAFGAIALGSIIWGLT